MKKCVALGALLSIAWIGAVHASDQQKVSDDVRQQLIALDKQWGEAGTDTAKLDKILADNLLAIGAAGEAQGKKDQMAAPGNAAAQGGTYSADEYQFVMVAPEVVVMTHRGRTMQDGKATESHRSLHVFQRQGGAQGAWRVVANAQVPITSPQ